MCGLAGVYRPDGATFEDEEWVGRALETIAHRGPDASKVEVTREAVHGHVRLAILDLDPRSNQPFVCGDGVLSYNGELWNYKWVRQQLVDEGYVFETTGDTEVVAAALSAWGVDRACRNFDGQFAFAWTDYSTNETFLARDPLGEIPLYILGSEETLWGLAGLSWASERKAFGDRGADAFPLPAGHWVQLGDESTCYARLARERFDYTPDLGYLEALLRVAVEKRLQADVPIAFLSSGGLDSTIILMLALDLGADVTAYTAGVAGQASADVAAARRICAHLGVPLAEVPAAPLDEAGAWIRRAVEVIEIPMKAQVEIAHPCLALAEAIGRDGFKVVLSGEGADELFGGYGNMARHARDDAEWLDTRREQMVKMSRGNCIRTNKTFMAYGVEARLPFLDGDVVREVLPLGLRACPPGKKLLKELGARIGVPDWVITQPKRTFQGSAGVIDRAGDLLAGQQVKTYNEVARACFGGIPRG